MACEVFEIRILEYVENTLPLVERAAIENHLADCAACQAFARDLRQIDAALTSGIKVPGMSAEFNRRLWQRIQTGMPRLSDAQRRERKQELQTEFEAGRSRLRKRMFEFDSLLDFLTYAALGGLAGWIAVELAPPLAVALTGLVSQSFSQTMLVSGIAGGLGLFFGLSIVFRQRCATGRVV
jgi:anti-sigma factor RsiW